MGTVYKPTFTKPLPMGAEIVTAKGQPVARWKPDDGKLQTAPVTTGKAGEPRIVVRSSTYVAKYRDGAGYVRKVATGCRDESAARSVLRDLERGAELVKAGVMTTAQNAAADYQTLPLELHLDAYATHFESIGATADYRVTTLSQIRRVANDCGFLRLTDLDRQQVERWLLRIARPQQSDGTTQPGASARTRNAYRGALVTFANWCVEMGRMTSNTLTGIPQANEKADPRRQRRSMTEAELIRLLDVARRRPLLDTLTVRRGKQRGKAVAQLQPETIARLELLGRERALIYKTLVLTGLRLNELRSLTVGQLDLDGPLAYVTLNAADEKNRQGSAIPLRSDLTDDLRQCSPECGNATAGPLVRLVTYPTR